METQQPESSPPPPPSAAEPDTHNSSPVSRETSPREGSSIFSTSGISSWAKNLKIPSQSNQDSSNEIAGKSTFARLTSGLGIRLSPRSAQQDEAAEGSSSASQTGVLGSLTKGLVDSSKNAVKAVQVKARHMVSQNKRRYQEDGFDLDMTYITENIIAMGFPAGDMSSGFFGYVEGFYRNHMEEVIRFFEMHHKGKYKVYNLCSERLYDAALLEGKVACFPFDDHNCPPIHLVTLFCRSAYSWLKEDIENVVVVHCKAGMARTGLMISSLLLYLKFFPTAEESIEYYNQKRCVDGKGLVLPSQIRYVKYFERTLTYFNGENPPPRRCMLRGIRLHKCPYWIRPSVTISNHNGVLFSTKKHPRTKDLMPEDFWFSAPRKGVMVFALPGEPGLTEVSGDFKIHFADRQGDFYCWVNTTMMENRTILHPSDLDGFDKRKLPSPGFQVEIVLVDYDSTSARPAPSAAKKLESASGTADKEPNAVPKEPAPAASNDSAGATGGEGKDDVFSDGESESAGSTRNRRDKTTPNAAEPAGSAKSAENTAIQKEVASVSQSVERISVKSDERPAAKASVAPTPTKDSLPLQTSVSEFKAIAADASVFSFGDEEDYESE